MEGYQLWLWCAPECEEQPVHLTQRWQEQKGVAVDKDFATNSFLVHGFWNYGYLVLKKDVEEDKEKLSLGVPGIFEKPEAVMAVLFGFPMFEALPEEMIKSPMNEVQNLLQKETNQETMAGTFGCWFVGLKM